jgi:acyl carrier protein
MATTLERFKEVLKPIINIETTPQTTVRSLHLDPLDLAALVNELEDEFEIEIEDAAAEKFATVGEILSYIDAAVSKKAGKQ